MYNIRIYYVLLCVISEYIDAYLLFYVMCNYVRIYYICSMLEYTYYDCIYFTTLFPQLISNMNQNQIQLNSQIS